MSTTKDYLIPFVGLKLGKHHFDFNIEKKFFEIFDYNEFNDSNIKVGIVLEKKSNLLELSFKHSGTVNVPCDMTNEDFDLPIKGKIKLIVRFGDQFNNENEELLILPHGEHQIDVSQYIYEMIALSVPSKRIHPGIKDGTLNTEVLVKLKELSVKETRIDSSNEQKEDSTDPRWDQLKKLLTDK